PPNETRICWQRKPAISVARCTRMPWKATKTISNCTRARLNRLRPTWRKRRSRSQAAEAAERYDRKASRIVRLAFLFVPVKHDGGRGSRGSPELRYNSCQHGARQQHRGSDQIGRVPPAAPGLVPSTSAQIALARRT